MKTIPTIHALLAAGGAALLAGCATVYEDQFQISQGWRVAEVVRVARASAVDNPANWECLRKAPEAVRQDSSYVLMSYRAFARKRQTLHPLPPNMNLQPGDRVYVKLGSCDNASIVKRAGASQILAPRSTLERSHSLEPHSLAGEHEAGVQRTRRSERHIQSAIAAPSTAESSLPSAARRGRRGAQDTGAIEELVRWIS